MAKTPLQIPKKRRQEVYDRDEGLCQICGKPTRNIHHIEPGKMGRRRNHHIANLITLCHVCHDRVHCGKDSEKLQRKCEQWSRERYGDTIDRIKRGEKVA